MGRGLFFVLQPNETGATGSHQAGEIHVRKSLIGGVLPDISEPGQNVERKLRVFHAQLGEAGTCTYTHWGKRKVPEDRLRQFPRTWRKDWEADDLIVLIPGTSEDFFLLYHFKPTDDVPPGLEDVWRTARTNTHGTFPVRTAAR